jgi:hypothetical protein
MCINCFSPGNCCLRISSKSFPRGLPGLYFFRHEKGWGGVKPGSKMGRDCLWKAWHKACLNLGIKKAYLYAGKKHSTVTDLKKTHRLTPEEIKGASKIKSNKAFDRYLVFDLEDSREIYLKASATKVLPKINPLNKGKVIKIKQK